jgi:SAM-dependent methyltransferase
MNQQEGQYWEAIGLDWSRTRPDGLWRDHCDAIHRRWLARWLPELPCAVLLKTDLFDEAVADGLCRTLQSHARTVVGMDLSLSTTRAVRARAPEFAVARADVRSLPFAGNAFGVVVSNSTLDHFHTPDEFIASLREIYRVLEPGGRLLLTMDNPVNPLIALRNALPISLLNRVGLVPYYVGVTFGPRQLRALLVQAGFKVVETGAIMHCLRVLAVPVSRVLRRLASPSVERGWLRALMHCEGLARLPIRFVTGHFVSVLATKA